MFSIVLGTTEPNKVGTVESVADNVRTCNITPINRCRIDTITSENKENDECNNKVTSESQALLHTYLAANVTLSNTGVTRAAEPGGGGLGLNNRRGSGGHDDVAYNKMHK